MAIADGGIQCRAVIVTALPIEFASVCEHLEERKEDTHPQGTVYECGQFRAANGRDWDIIVAEIGAGNPGAAAEVERAVAYWRPNVILFAGVAGGLKDVSIGDVVAGNKVYGYESGKESTGFKPRPSVHDSNYRLTQRAKAEARNGNWRQRILGSLPDSPPRALVGPIAAGEKVNADSQSATSQLIANAYGDSLAVEMEGYGFLHGVYLNQHISALVVRGISDLLDGKATADRAGSQERAARHASAFCFEVLAKLDSCPGETELAPGRDPSYTVEFSRIERTLAEHESRFRSIEKTLTLRAVADTAPAAVTDNRLTTEMNGARDLLNKGLARAARLVLDSLAKHVNEEGFTEELRFRLETNLGGSALALEEYEAAEKHFESALTIRPFDPKALANRAQIALVRDQGFAGLEYAIKARSLFPSDPHVMSVYLRALDAGGREAKIGELVRQNPWIQDNAECAFTLAFLAYDDGRYEEAEKLARISVEQAPDDAQSIELLARCIVTPLESALERNPPLPGKLPLEVVARASEAEVLFSRAIEILEHQDYRGLRQAAVANRAMVRGLLGRNDDALHDYDRALAEGLSQDIVKLNKGRLLLGMGRRHEALQLLIGLESVHESAWRPVAVAYLATKQPQKALTILLPRWNSPVIGLDRIRIGALLLEAYSDLGQTEPAEAIASSLETDYPDDAEAAAIAAEWRASQPEQTERALAQLYSAAAKALDDRQRDRINLLLADFYYRNQRFAEAADLYRNLAANSDHPAIRRRHLLSLFYSGSHREALRVAQSERAGGNAIPLTTAVEVTLLEEVGDIEEAKKLLTQLIALEPDDPDHRIHLAYLRYRSGDTEGSKEAVVGIAPEEVKGSAHQLMALARVRAWLDLDGVLELAYRARRLGFDVPDIHQAYMSLVLNRKRDQDYVLEISRARPGATVHLQSEGTQKIFTIVEGLDADLHRGELLPSDPVALKLLGLGLGDTVKLKQTDVESVTYQIVKIESQYVFAFQETLLNFSTWFPDVQGPEMMKADPAGIDKMLQLINQRQAQAEAVHELYKSRRITLGMLAQLSGNSAIQTWAGLQSGDDFRIIASLGEPQELQLEASLLLKAEILLIELTGLLTIASLELLRPLRERFKEIVAPQFLLDEINDELTLERAGLRSGLCTAGTLYRQGERYVWHEARTFQSEERTQFLEGLLDFVRHEVVLLPTPGILEFPQYGKGGPLGRAALAAILLAKDCGALLYSDDFVLRAVARNTWGVAGVWSQSLIRDLARTKSISGDQYHEGVIRLAQRNYQFVSMNEQDYIWALRQDGMRVTPGFLRALRALEGPDCTEDSAIIAAASLLRGTWLEASHSSRHLVLDACVSTLKHGRHPFVVLSKLEARMQRLLVMHPEALSEVLKSLTLWKQEPDLTDERLALRRASGAQTRR